MFSIKGITCVLLLVLIVATPMMAAGNASSIKVQGSLGIATSLENSCIAIWLEVPSGMALSGIKWYNNDGSVAFPEVLVQSGRPNSPVTLQEAVTVADDVYGRTGDWSDLAFSQLVGSESGGFYVIFRIPDGVTASADGAGGGPALGFTDAASGVPGWLSPDGLEWEPLHPNYGFAVQPILVAGTGEVLVKSSEKPGEQAGGQGIESKPPTPVSFPTVLHLAYPNPFNPQTTLKYSLREASRVDLAVFNVRGQMVKRLVSENREPGEYAVVWDGQDQRGATLASGVYFARFVAGNVAMTQRLVLVQ